MVDPGDAGSVGAALALEVQRAGAGRHVRPATPPVAIAEATSTWVWFVELAGDGLPADLRNPLVLRIYRPEEQRVADREHDLTRYLSGGGYPAPAPFLHGDGSGPLAHPWVLQARLAGTTALDAVSRRPWSIRRLVRDLGALQARLHGSDADGSPLPHDGPVSERYLVEDLDRRRRNVRAREASDGLGWLHASAAAYADRETVLCHGDFHARNVLVDHDAAPAGYGVVDWTDARLGDPHFDVARSLAIYWLAGVAADSGVLRVGLGALHGRLRDWHRTSYEQAARRTLDDRTLRWWEAVHLYRGWLQLQEGAEGAVAGPSSSTTDALPDDLAERLLARFSAIRRELD